MRTTKSRLMSVVAASSSAPFVELFVDLVSPHCWLAFEGLVRHTANWNINLQVRPMMQSSLYLDQPEISAKPGEHGTVEDDGSSSDQLENLRIGYTKREFLRTAAYWGLSVAHPSESHSLINLQAAYISNRFVLAVQQSRPELFTEMCRHLWHCRWVQHKPALHPADFMQLSLRAGVEDLSAAEQLLMSMDNLAVQKSAEENVLSAVRYGAYALPWIMVHADGLQFDFFGCQSLPIIADILGQPFLGPMRELYDESRYQIA